MFWVKEDQIPEKKCYVVRVLTFKMIFNNPDMTRDEILTNSINSFHPAAFSGKAPLLAENFYSLI